MRRFNIPIQTLTPIWTAGPTQKPDGLKMSGVMGGMRQAFEMLIRKHGGHTCDITGDAKKRCNYMTDTDVCPACRVFGCTGISRAFKFNLPLPTVNAVFPETDWLRPNRGHDNKPKGRSSSIDTWLASVVHKDESNIIRPDEHSKAQRILDKIKLPFSSEPVKSTVVELRKLFPENDNDEDNDHLENLLICLLQFMEKYSGLGSKVRQGWGQFRLDLSNEDRISQEEESAIFAQLIEDSPFSETRRATSLPNAKDCFSYELTVDDGNWDFNWPKNTSGFKSIGFGLRFALRRRIKFYEVDMRVSMPGISRDTRWRSQASGKWRHMPWSTSIPFVHALFGRDNATEQNKHAGIIGVSHVYQIGNDHKIKLFGCIPKDSYEYKGRSPIRLDWDRTQVENFIKREFRLELNERGANPR